MSDPTLMITFGVVPGNSSPKHTVAVESQDTKLAVEISDSITIGPHGLRPVYFVFEKWIDGQMIESGRIHWIRGKARIWSDFPDGSFMKLNAPSYGWAVMVETGQEKTINFFGATDLIVDGKGNVIDCGNNPEYEEARAEMKEIARKEAERQSAIKLQKSAATSYAMPTFTYFRT